MTRRTTLFVCSFLVLWIVAMPARAAGEACGGGSGVVCGADEFCKLAIGDCGQTGDQGVCTPTPQACTQEYDPVCGCDGVTYANECEADRAGVPIAAHGPCGQQVCGGIQGIPCEAGEFCVLPDGSCHVADAQGVCVPEPQGCPDVWDPVCGCDGRTYGNRCEAVAAGAQVAAEGECHPQVCGGIQGLPCDDPDAFCKLPPGMCDVSDLEGVCVPRPQDCPAIFDPVCGCDGRTYSNACEADQAGAQVDHDGECEQVCGGIQGIPCDDGEYCAFPDGTCDVADREGVCRSIPLGCPDVWDPVCGCDGVTYGNRCEAAAAGASVEHEGECEPPVCGGIAGIPCDDGEFCKFPAGQCDVADLQGECHPVPVACPLVYDPVCGCDGVTYNNECDADRAGAQIDHPGECDRVCGGIAGDPCREGEFCKLPPGECDSADLQGVCRPIPDACPEIYDPVCGCDGQTYSNRCFADQAGVQIDHDGECEQVCGGIQGIPCDDGEYCAFPDGTCDVSDREGVCRPVPQACPDVWDPVCGCDGVTYGNRCEAAAAGASIEHAGECEPQVCGGIAGIPCDDGEFCKFPAGQCDVADLQGECHPIPVACPLFYDPVCGCDGVTYNNECDADRAGAQIDHPGECDRVCGGIAGDPCREGEFCKLPPGECDSADLQGVCRPIPDACPEIYDPVCGCDGQTYSNTCFADQAGVQIDHDGECEQVCGGIAGIPCEDGEYCVFPDGTCDIADNQGVCRPVPQACPDVWDPVCGCDGVTYGNRCEAAAAEAQVAAEGPCEQVCGGIAGIPCDNPDEYCLFPVGSCNVSDAQGICVPIPDECPEVCHPVCGCDGVTYANECLSRQAQVSLAKRAPCDADGRLIHGVRFDTPERMRWQPAPGAHGYNVYRELHRLPPPESAGECFAAGIPQPGVAIAPVPEEGVVWLFQVTGVFSEGEGPLGLSSNCEPRAAEGPCDAQ